MVRPNYLIMVSFDAVGASDLEFLKTLPNFGNFMKDASLCTNVSSVYPSVTYPAHTSIVTGKYPSRHGIVNNTMIQPKLSFPDWYWKRKYIKGTTLYDEAKKHGMKTAALLWPVTAGAKIDYNAPEVLANRPWQNQYTVSLLNGSPLYELSVYLRFGHLMDGINQPALDNFVHQALIYTLRAKKPNLTMVHFTDVDTNRHRYGFSDPKITEALRRHDKRLGEIIETLKSIGIYEETAIVLLGDHSQMDSHMIVNLNAIFLKKGYLTVHPRTGRIKDWQVLTQTCDGSCYIYLKDTRNKQLYQDVKSLLYSLADKEEYGIETIYTHKEAVSMGADPKCAFMLEAKQGYYFLNDTDKLFVPVNRGDSLKNSHIMEATHGYHPDKPGYKTFFMASGPGIKKRIVIPSMSLVDEGPTLAELLGFTLPDTDGCVRKEILDFQNTSK